jgi:hypothetical protein
LGHLGHGRHKRQPNENATENESLHSTQWSWLATALNCAANSAER